MSDDLLRNYKFEEPSESKGKRVLLEKGEYPFRVLEVNEVEYSKANNNPYIPIRLAVGDDEEGVCYENLVFTEKAKWKIDSFLKSIWEGAEVGKEIDWTSPKFISWLIGRTGRCKVRVAPVQGKDYDRNEVDEFLYNRDQSAAVKKAAPAPHPVEEEDEDSIPF